MNFGRMFSAHPQPKLQPPKQQSFEAAISRDNNSYQRISMDQQEQLTLSFEPGLARKYQSLRECVAAGVYRAGLQRVAGHIDQAPSNLSTALSGDKGRRFGLDELEVYYDKTGDLDPLYYQIDRWLKGQNAVDKRHLLKQTDALMSEFRTVMNQLKD